MKQLRISIFLLALLSLCACKDSNVSGTGSTLLTESDGIVVGCDTFAISSEMDHAVRITFSPDSMLLGEADNMFGTVKADIFTQLACPLDFRYPAGSEVDSVVLYLYYRSWYGDGKAPISLRVYRMDKATFDYNGYYSYDIDPQEYCTLHDSTFLLSEPFVQTAEGYTDSTYSSLASSYVPYIRLKLSSEFAKSFFKIKDFSSQEEFNNRFKGLYITTDFGGSTVLHISSLSMSVHYHFAYSKQGTDTIVSDEKFFYANSEVRQVNRVVYPVDFLEDLSEYDDSVMFVVSPANIYTRLKLPMKSISKAIRDTLHNKRPYVNQAQLKIPILNYFVRPKEEEIRDTWANPANYMLIIREESAWRFFFDRELPSDTCGILASITTETAEDGTTQYSYVYDLAQLLTNQLRENNNDSVLNMLLIPVTVGTTTTSSTAYSSGTTSITSVRPMQTISATAIRSTASKQSPTALRVTYSGF